MRAGRIAPFLVLAGATWMGGWFLQEGVAREESVYTQVRVFQEVVDYVSDQFVDDVPEEEVYQSAIDGLLGGLDDPYSSFIEARDYEDVRIRTEGDYGGVGLEVVNRDGRVTVVAPIPGTPGARAGIRPGDWFVEIDGTNVEEMDVNDAVELLRGPPGTSVDVRIGRPGAIESLPFRLERAVVQLKAVPFAERLEGDIGYVPLRIFQSTAQDELQAAVDSLRSEGIRGLILDLRGNPGGLLEEGIGVTELFVDEGAAVVETRGRGAGQSALFDAQRGPDFPGLPIVVLVDATSASAAEIVAGALQDHDRALLVGLTTYGKGSVQTLFGLSGGSILRLTTARWFTPVGRSIQKDDTMGPAGAGHAALALSGAFVRHGDDRERPEFRSMAGRPLLGGGGIVPDVIVLPDTLTVDETGAVRTLHSVGGAFSATLFDFAVDYIQRRNALREDFSLSSGEMASFQQALLDAGVPASDEVFQPAERYVRYHLEREIGLQAFGDVGQFRRTLPYDRQLLRGLDLLDGVTTTRALLQASRAVVADAPAEAGAP
ncbi:MAG: S41 family peptidase [Gemmatimonadetes bacterium]|nr:S41 family peptidase [Gemmatimonadota bacterium]